MSILIVNQSIIDTLASFFSLVSVVVEKKIRDMSYDSVYDQFVCRFWNTNKPLWCMLLASTYSILIMTISRYIAVIHPLKYKTVRNDSRLFLCCDNV